MRCNMDLLKAAQVRAISENAIKNEYRVLQNVWAEIERCAQSGHMTAFPCVEKQFTAAVVTALKTRGFKVGIESGPIHDQLTIGWDL